MPEPRYRQVSIEDTPYYHCISRCVRRAFLCGEDSLSGFSFEHRRQWIADRIKLLCSVFAVDLCAYAIMSNHYHIVIRIDVEKVKEWSDEEVARRWMQVFTGPLLMHQYLGNADLTDTELERVRRCFQSGVTACVICPGSCAVSMNRLPAWPIGRPLYGPVLGRAFQVTGLLDPRAVLACMAYVDLNPIRAAMARTPGTI